MLDEPHLDDSVDVVASARCTAPDGVAETAFEPLFMRISTRLAGAQWHEVGAEVDLGLHSMLGFCCVDQVSIFGVLEGNAGAYLRHVASIPDLPSVPDHFSYGERYPWAFSKVVLRGQVMRCTRADELPAQGATDRGSMRELALTSALHIPLLIEGKVRFVLTAACSRRAAVWPERCVRRLQAFGEIFAHAISRAEAVGALLASQHDARDMLDVTHLGRWEWDIGADELQLSDEAKHILGADVPTICNLLELVQAGDRAAFAQSLDGARAHPGVRFKTRYATLTPAGETRVIQQWHEVLFPGERTSRLMATVQDVTSISKTEGEVAALREHQWHSARVAQTTLLVASLAHELCQPLAAMLNNAQAGLRFLNRGALDLNEIRDILTDIVASNRKANEVLGALRAMLRRQHTTRITFDAADVVHDVLALVRSELMSEQIEVETVLAPGCYLNADKTQIGQVLLNLIMNSIDAMRGSRTARSLKLTVRTTGDSHVEIAVRDCGRGIASDKHPKIFEAFWTTKEKGLGMGLPLCRAIIESYGGRIWCEDNEVHGVTFRFRLPLVEQAV